MTIEKTILANLIYNETFSRKVIPFLKKQYFSTNEGIVTETILKFFNEYNKLITKEILNIELSNRRDLNENQYKEVKKLVEDLVIAEPMNDIWLLDETEKFCKQRSVYNAIMDSIKIIDGKGTDKNQGNLFFHSMIELVGFYRNFLNGWNYGTIP